MSCVIYTNQSLVDASTEFVVKCTMHSSLIHRTECRLWNTECSHDAWLTLSQMCLSRFATPTTGRHTPLASNVITCVQYIIKREEAATRAAIYRSMQI